MIKQRSSKISPSQATAKETFNVFFQQFVGKVKIFASLKYCFNVTSKEVIAF